MLNTQLIKTLKSFSQEELNAFTDFINSPYFNKSKTVQRMWELMKKFAPDFDSEELGKEKMFLKIFPGKVYNYGTMKNLIHSVTILSEKFLEIYFHEQEKFQHEYNTLVYSIVKYYPEMFNKKFAKMMKDYDDTKEGMELHYLYKYMLMRLGASFAGLESRRDKILFEEGESLIYFSLIHLFQVTHNMSVFYNSESYEPEKNLTEEFLNCIDIENFLEKVKKVSPKHFRVVNIYYYMYLLKNEPQNDKYFYAFKDMVIDSRSFLHEYEFESIASAVANIVTERGFLGIKGTMKDAAEYQKVLNKIRSYPGETVSKMSIVTFINSIKTFSDAKDVIAIEEFYEENQNIIIEKEPYSVQNYYQAFFNFAKDDFNKALEYSSRIKTDINNIKINIKTLQIKCYYELGEANAFSYAVNASRQVLYRNESISNKLKDFTKNFLTSINSLFEYKYFHKGKLSDIVYEIMNSKMINKEWVLQKAEELNN